jgi:hypothetical protein
MGIETGTETMVTARHPGGGFGIIAITRLPKSRTDWAAVIDNQEMTGDEPGKHVWGYQF